MFVIEAAREHANCNLLSKWSNTFLPEGIHVVDLTLACTMPNSESLNQTMVLFVGLLADETDDWVFVDF